MGYLDTATNYLTDKQIKFLKKFVFVIFIGVGFVTIDQIFSFSYYTNLSNKTSQIKNINNILKSNNLTIKESNDLKKLRTEVIRHKYLFEKNFTSMFIITFSDKRNGLIHYVTSSWYLIFLMITLPFLGKYHPLFNFETLVIVFVVFEPILLFLSWFNAKVFAQIAQIGKNGNMNYVLNFFLGLITMIIIVNIRKLLIQSIIKIQKSNK